MFVYVCFLLWLISGLLWWVSVYVLFDVVASTAGLSGNACLGVWFVICCCDVFLLCILLGCCYGFVVLSYNCTWCG